MSDGTLKEPLLGLAGAIYKRRWELDNQSANLERSLFYYRRGYEAAGPADPHRELYVLRCGYLANLGLTRSYVGRESGHVVG